MLGPPIDAWYVWFGVSIAALVVLGVAATATPSLPDQSEPTAATIDTVAASHQPATGHSRLDADRVRVEPYRITLEGDRSETAILRRGPVTAAERGTALAAVAHGTPPEAAFEDSAAFRQAAHEARTDERVLEPVGDELVVRSVHWEDASVTIVTA